MTDDEDAPSPGLGDVLADGARFAREDVEGAAPAWIEETTRFERVGLGLSVVVLALFAYDGLVGDGSLWVVPAGLVWHAIVVALIRADVAERRLQNPARFVDRVLDDEEADP